MRCYIGPCANEAEQGSNVCRFCKKAAQILGIGTFEKDETMANKKSTEKTQKKIQSKVGAMREQREAKTSESAPESKPKTVAAWFYGSANVGEDMIQSEPEEHADKSAAQKAFDERGSKLFVRGPFESKHAASSAILAEREEFEAEQDEEERAPEPTVGDGAPILHTNAIVDELLEEGAIADDDAPTSTPPSSGKPGAKPSFHRQYGLVKLRRAVKMLASYVPGFRKWLGTADGTRCEVEQALALLEIATTKTEAYAPTKRGGKKREDLDVGDKVRVIKGKIATYASDIEISEEDLSNLIVSKVISETKGEGDKAKTKVTHYMAKVRGEGVALRFPASDLELDF